MEPNTEEDNLLESRKLGAKQTLNSKNSDLIDHQKLNLEKS